MDPRFHLQMNVRAKTKIEETNLKRFRRVGVVGAVIGLLAGFATLILPTPVGATPYPPSTSSCTYNGSLSAATGLVPNTSATSTPTPGSTVAVSCTGLPTSVTSFLLAESSPLAGIVDPATDNTAFADTGALGSCAGPGDGTCSGTFVVPASFTSSDTNGLCPPSQAQVNAGLVTCALAVVDGTTPVNTGLLFYSGQPTPAAPTASMAPAGEPGESFAVTGSGWWGGGVLGAPNATTGVPGFTTLVGTATAVNTLSATPPVYCATGFSATGPCAGHTVGTLLPPVFSGTITIPSTAPPGATAVTIAEPNASGAAGLTGISTSESSTTVNATAPFDVLGTPSIVVSPTSGGLGVSVAVSGSNFDPQGGTASVTFTHGLPTPDALSGIAVHADGTFTTTLAVGQSEINYLDSLSGPPSQASDPVDAAQTESTAAGGLTLTASTPFSVLGTSAGPCSTVGGSGNTCKVNQVIDETVTGVADGLTIEEPGPAHSTCSVSGASNSTDGIHLALSGVTLNGRSQVAHGCLNTVTIIDARGTLVGWTTTGQLETDFLGPNVGANAWDHVIPAQNLTWTPSRSLTFPSDPSGVLSEVAAGAAGPLPTALQYSGLNGAAGPYPGVSESSTPIDLCSAASGGGGGTFNCDAGLALVVPAFVAAGTYQATLDLVVS